LGRFSNGSPTSAPSAPIHSARFYLTKTMIQATSWFYGRTFAVSGGPIEGSAFS
jgi:hypothetical protein